MSNWILRIIATLTATCCLCGTSLGAYTWANVTPAITTPPAAPTGVVDPIQFSATCTPGGTDPACTGGYIVVAPNMPPPVIAPNPYVTVLNGVISFGGNSTYNPVLARGSTGTITFVANTMNGAQSQGTSFKIK